MVEIHVEVVKPFDKGQGLKDVEVVDVKGMARQSQVGLIHQHCCPVNDRVHQQVFPKRQVDGFPRKDLVSG